MIDRHARASTVEWQANGEFGNLISTDIVAVLIPSQGRPEAALGAVRSALETASTPERLRILVGVEPDEARSYREVIGDAAVRIHVLQAGGSYVRAIRELHRWVAAGIYGLCADDFVFETPGWDSRIRRAAADLPARLGLIHGDDGFQGERLATAPFLTTEWIACVGDVLPGAYQHMYCDTEVTDIARQAGLLRFLPDVRITHRHHLTGRAAFDGTYERSSRTMAAGRAEFERRAGERRRLADRLIDASRAPLLSLLIPSLRQRAELLDALLRELRRQVGALPDSSVVEVVVEPDGGERAVGAKRNSLIARARGKWIVFIDDDDEVAADYLAELLQALAADPDCVTFRGRMTSDDHPLLEFDFSLAHRGWNRPSDRLAVRTPNHLCAIRRSIARAVPFEEIDFGEDLKWSNAIHTLLKSEVKIEKVLYHYRFRTTSPAIPSAGQRRVATARRPGIGFPSSQQELLLSAALGRDEIAVRAWERWEEEVGPGRADPASLRLLPLAWWNLVRRGASGPRINRLKTYYWESWAKSNALLELAAEQTAAFGAQGIPTILLKGAALASSYYEKAALRPMSDVDLLVPDAAAGEAQRILESSGWRPMQRLPALPLLHGLGFEDGAGRLLDLHRHALVEGCRPEADDGFWARAEAVKIAGTAARILAPADQLLHVCVHGLRWSKVPAIQWVADAMVILESASDRIDWDLMVEEARARRVVVPLRRALEYVRSGFDVPALDPVCRHLSALRCNLGERIEFETRIRPPSLGRGLLLHWFDHLRLREEAPWPSRVLGFPGYWRDLWGLRTLKDIPSAAVRKSAGRLRERIRGA